MTRFVYVADSHWGASPMGYQQQKGFPERLPEIAAALGEWIRERGGVDFVLHGGDMVERASAESIAGAAAAFDLPVPVYLCMGNHDLTDRASLALWSRGAARCFRGGGPEFAIETPDCLVHVVPNQWCEQPYFWERAQDPHFDDGQVRRLEERLSSRPDAVHLLATHVPVLDLPAEQAGQTEPVHQGAVGAWPAGVLRLVERHRRIGCVLGAHSHLNMNVERGGVNFVTVSALAEVPFEFKLFDVGAGRIAMSTVSLKDRLRFAAPYDYDRTYVQGRPRDRAFARDLW